MKIEDVYLDDILNEINNNQSENNSSDSNYEDIINANYNFEHTIDMNNLNTFNNDFFNPNNQNLNKVKEASSNHNFESDKTTFVPNTDSESVKEYRPNTDSESVKEYREEVISVLKSISEKKLAEESSNEDRYQKDTYKSDDRNLYEKNIYDAYKGKGSIYTLNDDVRALKGDIGTLKRYNLEGNIEMYLDKQPYLKRKDYEIYLKVKRFLITLGFLWFLSYAFLGEGYEAEMQGVSILIAGLFINIFRNVTRKENIVKAMKHEKVITRYKEKMLLNKGLLMMIFNTIKIVVMIALLVEVASSNFYFSLLEFLTDLILGTFVTFGVVQVLFIIPEIIVVAIQKSMLRDSKAEEYKKIDEQKNQNKENPSLREELDIVTYL